MPDGLLHRTIWEVAPYKFFSKIARQVNEKFNQLDQQKESATVSRDRL